MYNFIMATAGQQDVNRLKNQKEKDEAYYDSYKYDSDGQLKNGVK